MRYESLLNRGLNLSLEMTKKWPDSSSRFLLS